MARYSFLSMNAKMLFLSAVAGVLAFVAGFGAAADADSKPSASDSYTWSAALVSLDEAAATAAVKSRLTAHATVEGLSDLAEGERVTIVWSGMNWASGVRAITPGDERRVDGLTLPAEFVSLEGDGQYVVFSVPVPSDSLAKLSSLPPGTWVTMTSPRQLSGWDEAVVEARPYNDVDAG